MTAENSQPADQPIRSNWNKQRETQDRKNPMGEFMTGPSMFEEGDDDYLDPGQAPEPHNELDTMMDQYLDQMSGEVTPGQMLTVPIVAIKADHVLVDVGEKSEGVILLREFPIVDNKPAVQVGDVVDVVVKGFDAESGLINLSYQEARRRKAMKLVKDALDNQTPVKGVVTRTVKGGLIVDIGTTAFLPASQIDLRRIDNFEEWIGREVEGLVIEFVPEKRRIIISRRKLLELARESARQNIMHKLTVGQTVEVAVKRIVEFGVFVDLEGVDGLIPRSEISWQRNARPEDYMQVGDALTARIIEINPDTGKVTLSRRQAHVNPWDTAAERYPVGSTVNGHVVSLTSYGAFVRLEEGLDGMIHVSDMAWDAAGKRPTEYVTTGQEVAATVLGVDPNAKRISLGLKQLTADPWEAMEAAYPKGTRIRGRITGLTKYGAFVELEPGIEGMIHVSDVSWEKRVSQPRDVFKRGDEVEACVLEVDRNRRRISLGVKQLSESPVERYLMTHATGDIVDADVISLTEFGAFLRLEDGVEGFMHVSQMDTERVASPNQVLKVGEKIQAKIMKIEGDTGKISLSRRQMIKDQERQTISAYMKRGKREGSSLISMGDLMGDIVLEDDLPVVEAPKPPESKRETPRREAPAPAAEPPPVESLVEAPAPPAEPELPVLTDDPSVQTGEAPEAQVSIGNEIGDEDLPEVLPPAPPEIPEPPPETPETPSETPETRPEEPRDLS